MLEKSFGLLYFLKQPKNKKTVRRYVYLRITVDGVSRELSTKRTWYPERWNQESGRATGTKEDAKSLNAFLDMLSAKVFQAKASLLATNKPVTAEVLRNIVTGKDHEAKMLLQIFKVHNEQIKSLIGIDYAPATLTRYKTTHDHVQSFLKWKYDLDDISLIRLNYEFVADFALWLKTIRHCSHNTTVKYISNLKKIVLQCIRKGWLPQDPFIDFKTVKKEVKKVALTDDDLYRIRRKKFYSERLEAVRDIFLFSCYTGLAYADVKKLKRNMIVKGIDNEQWIITERQKTGSPTRLPLLPIAAEIINKYAKHPKCLQDGMALPVLTNQKMNAYLKEIADVCGINKNLTFHIARHTFATTITLSNGVPLETVSKMLGHKSLAQTQHYAKILDLKVSSDMQSLKVKLSANR